MQTRSQRSRGGEPDKPVLSSVFVRLVSPLCRISEALASASIHANRTAKYLFYSDQDFPCPLAVFGVLGVFCDHPCHSLSHPRPYPQSSCGRATRCFFYSTFCCFMWRLYKCTWHLVLIRFFCSLAFLPLRLSPLELLGISERLENDGLWLLVFVCIVRAH